MLIVHNKANRVSAYTLVELLVVIGILSIAFSFLYVGFGSGDGANLSSAQRTLAGLVKAARAQAILNNAEVRLIIHDDDDIAEIEKYRRFVGIVYKERNGAGWIAADKGTYLPKGIYFDSATSNDMSGANGSTALTMRINFPRLSAQSEGVGTDFLYYKFNSNGTSANSNAYLVFRAGKVVPGAADAVTLELPSAGEQKSLVRSGLLFRQSGTATLINEPEDIDI